MGSIRNTEVHNAFQSKLNEYNLSNGKLKLFAKVLERVAKESFETKQNKRESLRNSINETLAKKDAVLNAFIHANSESVRKSMEDKVEFFESEIRVLKKALDTSETFEEFYEPITNKIINKLENPAQTWQSLDIRKKVLFQKWVFPEGMELTPDLDLRTSRICLTYGVIRGFGMELSNKIELPLLELRLFAKYFSSIEGKGT